MTTLIELIHFKKLWGSRKENAENAVKYYEEEITKKVKEIAEMVKPEEEN